MEKREVVIAMALFGSGSYFPLGVFDDEETAREEVKLTEPSYAFYIHTEINKNMEEEKKEAAKRRREDWGRKMRNIARG